MKCWSAEIGYERLHFFDRNNVANFQTIMAVLSYVKSYLIPTFAAISAICETVLIWHLAARWLWRRGRQKRLRV